MCKYYKEKQQSKIQESGRAARWIFIVLMRVCMRSIWNFTKKSMEKLKIKGKRTIKRVKTVISSWLI